MNAAHRAHARKLARQRLQDGISRPENRVHILYYPADCPFAEDEIMGLSTPLPPLDDESRYSARYYSLGELAE